MYDTLAEWLRRQPAKLAYSLVAAIAQLGERQTEDLKVPGSIPGGGNISFSNLCGAMDNASLS